MQAHLVSIVSVAFALTACGQSADIATDAAASGRGRFAGIGIYDAGRLWSQMPEPAGQRDPKLAGLADDEHVIVVVDSHTGEVRQCGDHSGYCVALNPWRGTAAVSLPATLAKHASELVDDQRGETNAVDQAR